MTEEIEPMTASQAICAIPVEIRPAIVAWLEAMAVNAEATALRVESEDKDHKHPGIQGLARYWKNVASGHRLAAVRMKMSGAVPKRSTEGRKNVRRK